MACLLANTVFYYRLWWHDRIDTPYPLPTPLIICFLLAAWTLCTRDWTRAAERSPQKLPEFTPASRAQRIRAAAFIAATLAFAAAVFFIHTWKRPVPPQGVDLAIVLGHRVLPDGSASVTLADRALIAADLYHRGLVRHLFLSGMISPPEIPGGPERNEPAAMRDVCLAAGVPEAALTLDPVGVNTRATAFNAAQFMHAHGYQTAVVCTTNFHLFRSVMACRESGFDPCAEPAVRTGWICIDPRDTLRELVGIAVYTLDPNYRLPKAQTMQLANPRVVVKKSANTVELFDGHTLVKTYPCITGSNPGDKEKENDRKTPLGAFRIVFKNPQSKFHLSLGLDYPSAEDAARGLATGLITREQYAEILTALRSDLSLPENQKKLWYTPLGGEIFLHGHAENRTGTAGCIALSNPDIEELYALLPLQTPVTVLP
jgi:vancomycin permeability regulator SanA